MPKHLFDQLKIDSAISEDREKDIFINDIMYQQNRVTVPKINYKKGGFKIGSSVMKNTEFGNSDLKMKNVEMPYNYQKSNDMSSYR